jgi:uncharacterized protein
VTKTVGTFARTVREIENLFIPLSDGTRLAARVWLPDDAEADPVPSSSCPIASGTARRRATP